MSGTADIYGKSEYGCDFCKKSAVYAGGMSFGRDIPLFLSKSGAILLHGAKKTGNIVNCNKEKLANKKKEKARKKLLEGEHSEKGE